MKEKRNYSIDTLKLLCTILVIIIHASIKGVSYLKPILYCAVPIFFMISGYFTYGKNNLKKTINTRLLRMIKIFIYSFLFYYIINIIINGLGTNADFIYNIVRALITNAIPYAEHLWYICAYVYVLIIFLFIDKYNLYKYLFYSIPILFILGVFLGKYCEIVFSYSIPSAILSRNFLFTGLPFFALGMLVKRIHTYIHTRKILYISIAGCIIFYFLGYLENSYLPLNIHGDMFITTIFLSFFIFILFLNIRQYKDNIFSKIGREYSLYVYIYHWLFAIYLLPIFVKKYHINNYIYFSAILTFVLTLLFIYVLRKLRIIGRFI